MENNQLSGYEDIDKLVSNQNKMMDNALEQQNALVDKSTQMSVDRLNKNKADLDQETEKTNKGLYQEYMKAQNPYGYNAEALASAGLGRSGYAESTQAKMYNTYQNNITETMNNARNLKSNFDFEINQAMQSGDLEKAKNAYNMYNQKMELLAQEYQLRNNREQYLYQKEQDALAQSNWQKQFDYQAGRDKVADDRYDQQWAYQKERDKIADDRYLSEQERQKRLDELDEKWRQAQFDYQKGRDEVSDARYDREFDYQKARDEVSDARYAQEFAYNKELNDRQFDYQKARDAVSDARYDREFDYNATRDQINDARYADEIAYSREMDAKKWEYQKERDRIEDDRYISEQERQRRLDELDEKWRQLQYEYQKSRDAVSDEQWNKSYELQKKTANSSSRSYSGNTEQKTIKLDETPEKATPTPQEIMANVESVVGAFRKDENGNYIDKPLRDKLSGRYFSSIEEILNYYGYGSVN